MFVLDGGEDLRRLAAGVDRAAGGGKAGLLAAKLLRAQRQKCFGRESYQLARQHLAVALAAQREVLIGLGQLLGFEKVGIGAEGGGGPLGRFAEARLKRRVTRAAKRRDDVRFQELRRAL